MERLRSLPDSQVRDRLGRCPRRSHGRIGAPTSIFRPVFHGDVRRPFSIDVTRVYSNQNRGRNQRRGFPVLGCEQANYQHRPFMVYSPVAGRSTEYVHRHSKAKDGHSKAGHPCRRNCARPLIDITFER
jgi:hypothetical protein